MSTAAPARTKPMPKALDLQTLFSWLLADGIVEQHEIVRVKDAVYRTVQALNAMVARLEGMAEK